MITRVGARLGGGLGNAFWKLWTASAAANLADGIYWVALPLLAIQVTDSPVLVAGVTAASRLPWLLFALIAGAVADRADRRRIMVSVDAVRVVAIGILAAAVLLGAASLPLLYIVAFALGLAETFFDTSAQSVMPSIVARDRLTQANGRLYAVELTMNQFLGPPLGGLLAAAGIGLALAGSAFGYLLALGALLLIRGSFRPASDRPRARMDREIADGLRYLWGQHVLRTLAVMVGVQNLANAGVGAVLVLYVVAPGPLGLSEVGFGLLLTTFALGSLFATAATSAGERRLGRANLLTASLLLNGVAYLVPVVTTNVWLIGAAFAVQGVAIVAWNIVTVSLRQSIVPDGLLGRVNATYRLLAWGTMPVGAALGGVVAQLYGIPVVFLIAGLATLVLIATRLFLTDAAISAAEGGAGGPAAGGGRAPEPEPAR